MPLLRIETNIAKSKIPADFAKVTTALVAKLLGKPEESCSVAVIPDTMITRGGSDDPCGFGTLLSIGKLGPEENKKHSEMISTHIEKQLGISKSRFALHFVDVKSFEVGYYGTTMEEILKSKSSMH